MALAWPGWMEDRDIGGQFAQFDLVCHIHIPSDAISGLIHCADVKSVNVF